MKRLLSFLTALLYIITLSAPASAAGADAYAVYQKSVKNHAITIIIGDDGFFKSRTDSYVYLADDGKATKSKVTMKINAKSVNSVTKIDFPADLDSYNTPEN